jgi:hypothetical protein
MNKSEPGTPPRSASGVIPAAVVAVIVLCAFQGWWALRIDGRLEEVASMRTDLAGRLDEMEDLVARLEKAGLQATSVADRVTSLETKLDPVLAMADEFSLVQDDIAQTSTRIAKLTVAFEQEFGIEVDNPAPSMPELDWTQPALREAARVAAAEVGIELSDDEVRVPSRFALREGLLEYFAVLKGGKEHEALISIVGNTPPDQRRPAEFGARLNNAILALGFKRGKPIRFTPNGARPAVGDTIYVYIEWRLDDGVRIVRAEDLVWNRLTGSPMEREKWVYVGSSYVSGSEPGATTYAADLTAEAIACYSAVNTIVDNVAEGAADDTVFVAATPRIPAGVTDVTLLLRRTPRADVYEFPAPPTMKFDVDDEPEAPPRDDDDDAHR